MTVPGECPLAEYNSLLAHRLGCRLDDDGVGLNLFRDKERCDSAGGDTRFDERRDDHGQDSERESQQIKER
jgi:hypothetical protein